MSTTLTEQPASALTLWAADARQAAEIAAMLAKTSFVPLSMRGNTEDVTAAILAGAELGLAPMAAMRSMVVIEGTPALLAHAMRGLVQSRGHELQKVVSGPTKVIYRGRRLGEEEWQTVEWTIERAAALGLTGNPDYQRQPETMLIARASGEICRLIAADVLFAMPYAAEELDGQTAAFAGFAQQPVTITEILAAAPEPAARPARGRPRRPAVEAWPAEEQPAPEPAESADADQAAFQPFEASAVHGAS